MILDRLGVSRETLDRLRLHHDLLVKWNGQINLVSPKSLADGWRRHILDSAQVLLHTGRDMRHWADFGSGAGFPGVTIAILCHQIAPHTTVTLVESDRRKSAFLRTVLRETGVGGTVLARRIEDLPPLGADVLTARALAPLPRLLDLLAPHMTADATALLLKGAGWKKEMADAAKAWTFRSQVLKSETDPDAVIMKLEGLGHV